MKKILLPLLFAFVLPASFSCSTMRYTLNEADAAAAIRQLLEIGTKEGSLTGAFSKETVMSTLFPESLRKTLNILNQLGLTNEIDRFTTTLGTAAEKTATASVPIFLSGINNMKFTDAVSIIKNGGTAATDYLRSSIGDTLRRSITPVMKTALEEYKLNEQWEKIIKPAQALAGNKLNLDLANLMAGLVSEKMFQKIEEKEKQVRTNASARTTTLLQKVFSGNKS
jgi:membrane carboxypeptidase/penicillin-binding protein